MEIMQVSTGTASSLRIYSRKLRNHWGGNKVQRCELHSGRLGSWCELETLPSLKKKNGWLVHTADGVYMYPHTVSDWLDFMCTCCSNHSMHPIEPIQ